MGIIIRPTLNDRLYAFDSVIGQNTGSISIDTSNKIIELDPVKRFVVGVFQQSSDITWVGAVINFNSGNSIDSIYPSTSGNLGLWVLVEYPPTVNIS